MSSIIVAPTSPTRSRARRRTMAGAVLVSLVAAFTSVLSATPAQADPDRTAYLVQTTRLSAAPRSWMSPITIRRSIYLAPAVYRIRSTFRPTWQQSPTEATSLEVKSWFGGVYTMKSTITPKDGYYLVESRLVDSGDWIVGRVTVPYYTNTYNQWDGVWGMKLYPERWLCPDCTHPSS